MGDNVRAAASVRAEASVQTVANARTAARARTEALRKAEADRGRPEALRSEHVPAREPRVNLGWERRGPPVFHLAEELEFRQCSLDVLPEADYRHLMNDAKRACSHLTAEWVAYTEHLKGSYPFLFSLAARINPFSPDPSAIIR